jgi:hypothetical protein
MGGRQGKEGKVHVVSFMKEWCFGRRRLMKANVEPEDGNTMKAN